VLELFFLVPHTYDFANITIPSIQLPPSILVTLRLLTILRLGFELFFLVPHTYDFANITIPSIQLPPAILVTFRFGIVSFLFYSLLPPPRSHYRSFNNTPLRPTTRAMVVCYCVISMTSHHVVTEITQSRTAVALAAILGHFSALTPNHLLH